MKSVRTIAATVLLLPVVVGIAGVAGASGRTEYMPCAYEDSNNCVWDAKHMGNGTGQSYFAGVDGKVYPLPHHIAHHLLYP